MRPLNCKLWRDVWHLRGQLVAIALVVACGVAVVVTASTAYHSLVVSQATYYASYRFADLFAHVKRAPEAVAARLAAIPGVAAVQTRLVFDVTLDVPGLAEPATGHLVSLPTRRAAASCTDAHRAPCHASHLRLQFLRLEQLCLRIPLRRSELRPLRTGSGHAVCRRVVADELFSGMQSRCRRTKRPLQSPHAAAERSGHRPRRRHAGR